jgi:parallel beta-helix repeat protein
MVFKKFIVLAVLIAVLLAFFAAPRAGAVVYDDVITKSPMADVRAFGAVGDGVTADQAAFQAANDYLVDGGTVFVPPGTYLFESTLWLSANVNLLGAGASSVIKCNSMASSGGFSAIISSENCDISRLKLSGVSENVGESIGIYIKYGFNSKVTECLLEGFKFGIILSGRDITISRNRISGCWSSGVYMYDLDGAVISTNIVNSCTYYDGIKGTPWVFGTTVVRFLKHIIISDNITWDCGRDGIDVAAQMMDIQLVNNISYGNYYKGIDIKLTDPVIYGTDTAKLIIINNNICANSDRSQGINADDLEDILVSGNLVYDNPEMGIRNVYNTGASIVHNYFAKNNPGIRIQGVAGFEAEYVNVVGNVVLSNTNYGIEALQSYNDGNGYVQWAWLADNMVMNSSSFSTSSGIYVFSDNSDVYVENNLVPDSRVTSGRGIYVNGSGNVARNNEIADAGIKTLAQSSSPAVWGGRVFRTGNLSSRSFSSFTGGRKGQVLTIMINDNNTTFVHGGSSIVLSGSVNWSPSVNDTIALMYDGSKWVELYRSDNS